MNKLNRSDLLIVFILFACLAEAKLEFESLKFEHATEFGEATVPFEFRFTNAGAKTIEITEITTTCACTTGDLTKKVYQPGESGSVGNGVRPNIAKRRLARAAGAGR
jgi:hypothetical protein